MTEETKQEDKGAIVRGEVYGNEEDAKFAIDLIETINHDLEAREKESAVFNNIPYSTAYQYNLKKAINHAPVRKEGEERELSMGLPHEKIVGFISFFLKYAFRRRFECQGEDGKVMEGLGEIYDLMVEHSYKLEQFERQLAYIYFETYAQGDAFVLDDWQVRNIPTRIPKKKDKKIGAENMDFTYEFLDGLEYEPGEMIQERKAVSKLMDGRKVILGNPEIPFIQDQPHITIEEVIPRKDAELVYGSLKRWKHVPKTMDGITEITSGNATTLFDRERLEDSDKQVMVHRYYDKLNNRFNIMVNGIVMLPKDTPLTLWYPRGNYPLSKVSAEIIPHSAYSRSIPMKVKFNSDYIDWALTKLAEKFEQGVDPALLVRGRYTLTKDLFKAGQRTHGISRTDYEKADPDNLGITNSEFSFVSLLKEVIEAQTLNSTTTGEVADQSTATAVNAAQNNQIEKLGMLLDGLVYGFMDMALRRAETIESRYTIKQKETIVDGKKIDVYQDFTVNMDGINHAVSMDTSLDEEGYDAQTERDALFTKAFRDKQNGKNNEYHKVNPNIIRARKYTVTCSIVPNRRKDPYLQMIEMREEFAWLMQTFGRMMNLEEIKKEYLKTTGRPDKIFLPGDAMRLNDMLNEAGTEQNAPSPFNRGSFGETGLKPALSGNK